MTDLDTNATDTPPADRERILFVDDEDRVLAGLRRMLHRMTDKWDMTFVNNGADALDVIKKEAIDVIVTDMRMPGMDGAELLSIVSRRSPQTIRMVLSGHCDPDYVYRSIGQAHQYLSKPCDREHLKQAVSRACALRDVLKDERLRATLSRMTTLPSPPAIYAELTAVIDSDDVSLDRVGQIISSDVSMTAKVLQLVNSAWFALRRTVTDPTDAVLLLGTEALKALVLSAHVFSELDSDRSHVLNEICDHSVRVAELARRIVLEETGDRPTANFAFTAGMMHEVGLVVLTANDPIALDDVVREAKKSDLDLLQAERKILNATHGQIGAYLLGLWGMPNPILEALAFFDAPRRCPSDDFSALSALHVADALIHETRPGPLRPHCIDRLYLHRIGCYGRLDSWRELATLSPED